MIRASFVLLALLGQLSAVAQSSPVAAVLDIVNSSAIDRREEMVEVPVSAVKWPDVFRLEDQQGKEIPYQLLFGGNVSAQSVLFPVNLSAGKTMQVKVINGPPSPVTPRVFGRVVPERKDDFTWENDRVAFRMYGPALQADGEISNGIDFWAKRTDALIINKWYELNDYHKDHGEGMDFYKVGPTLGAGASAPFVNGKLYRSKNYTKAEILDKGPLRLRFKLYYAPWMVEQDTVNMVLDIRLDAGSHVNKVEATYQFSGKPLPLAAGFFAPTGSSAEWHDDHGILVQNPPQGEEGLLTFGMLLPPGEKLPAYKSAEEHNLLVWQNKTRITYWQGGAWNKAGLFQGIHEFQPHLVQVKKKLAQPLQVRVRK